MQLQALYCLASLGKLESGMWRSGFVHKVFSFWPSK